MKKTLFILAAAATLFCACNKPVEMAPATVEGSTFTAILDDTKTALQSDGKVYWNIGDNIIIAWNGGSVKASANQAGPITSFTAEVGDASKYFAASPNYSVTVPTNDTTFDFQVNISKTQHGTFAEANVAVAVCDGASKNFAFKNVCSVLKVTITRSDITEIRFRPTPDTKIIGLKSIKFVEGLPTIVGADGNVEAILTPASGSVFAPGDYYFGVAPVECQEGFVFKCKKTDGTYLPFKEWTHKYALTRSTVIDFGVIDDTEKTLYATPEGAGLKNGKSWANAFGATELGEALASAEGLSGVTVRMGGGDYSLTKDTLAYAADVVTVLEGGYNASTGVKDPANQVTAFTGNDTKGIFLIGTHSVLTFNNITFKHAKVDATKKIRAVNVASKSAVIKFNDCQFVDNYSNVSKAYGAALYVSSGKVYLNNCYFANNVTSGVGQGGALRVDGDNSCVMLNNCSFTGNSITDASHGTAICSAGPIAMNKCTFYDNVEKDGINQSVLNIAHNSIMSNCVVIGASNVSTGIGAIRYDNGAIDSNKNATGKYSYMINNIIINTYSGANIAWGVWAKSTARASGQYNFYCGKDGGNGTENTITSGTGDVSVTAPGQTWTINSATHKVEFAGALPGYTAASQSDVKNYISNCSFTYASSSTTLGADFAAWLTSIGEF